MGPMRRLTMPNIRIVQGDPELRFQRFSPTGWRNSATTTLPPRGNCGARLKKDMWSWTPTNRPRFSRALQFGEDYLAAANGTPVRATNAWPVDAITPVTLARAAHLINASLGLHGAKIDRFAGDTSGVVWVQQAANTNDPVAGWVWANRRIPKIPQRRWIT